MDIDATDPSSFFLSLTRDASIADGDVELIREMQHNYDHKLWHPLTSLLLKFFTLTQNPSLRKPIYENVIENIGTFIQPVLLVKLAALTADTLDPIEAEAFLLRLKEYKGVVSDPCAHSLLLTQLSLKILQTNRKDSISVATQNSNQSIELIEGIPHIDKSIYASHWLLTSTIAKISNDRSSFYHDAIKYLEVAENLSREEMLSWTTTIGIAALTGANIYYFGDFINSKYFSELKNPTNSPSVSNIGLLIENMEYGQARESLSLLQSLQDIVIPQSEVVVVMEKISLMSIVNLVFQRSLTGGSKSIKFDEIAESASISYDKVELALMKLIAQGLVKGLIDGTTNLFKYSWVHPRSLTVSNCHQLSRRFSQWLQHAETALESMKESSPAAE